jgi:hypothetical protein
MTAPEPWREPQPTPRPPKARDPEACNPGESEMSWGPGLVPVHANGRPPSEGGMYMPKCPLVELRSNTLTPRQQRRPKGEAKGYPGDRVAR